MAQRSLSSLVSLLGLGAALLTGCIGSSETFAIRNDTAAPLEATVELRGEFKAYDCADSEARSATTVRATATLTIAPGRRLCLWGPGDTPGVDALDALGRLRVVQGVEVCVEGDREAVIARFVEGDTLPTMDVKEADCR